MLSRYFIASKELFRRMHAIQMLRTTNNGVNNLPLLSQSKLQRIGLLARDYSERDRRDGKKEIRKKRQTMSDLDISVPHSVEELLHDSENLQKEVVVVFEDGSENIMKMIDASNAVKQGKTKLDFMEEREGIKVYQLRKIVVTTTKSLHISDNITERDLQIKVNQALNHIMKGKRIDFKLKGKKKNDTEFIKNVENQINKFIKERISEIITEDDSRPEFTIKSAESVIMFRPV